MNTAALHSLDAERAVLGAVLVSPKTYADAAFLEPEAFYQPANRAIWEAMQALDGASLPIDALTVEQRMRQLDTFERLNAVGGANYLRELTLDAITFTNVGYHASTVTTKAHRRDLFGLLQRLATDALDETVTDDDLAANVETQVLQVMRRKHGSAAAVPLKQQLQAFGQELKQRLERPGGLTGVTTGFAELDDVVNGWQRGDLTILAARPSMGKSAFAMNSAIAAAASGVPVLVYSVEMTQIALAERLISADASVNGRALRQPAALSVRDHMAIAKSVSRLVDFPVWVDASTTLSVQEIRSRTRAWRMNKTKPSQDALVVVDYLQLLELTDERNRVAEIGKVSRGLKLLAKEINAPVVALSQLSRKPEEREDKRPRMADLRDSGSLEQDGDLIIGIYRDEVYNANSREPGVAELLVLKNRMGAIGSVKLGWRGEFSRFESRGAA